MGRGKTENTNTIRMNPHAWYLQMKSKKNERIAEQNTFEQWMKTKTHKENAWRTNVMRNMIRKPTRLALGRASSQKNKSENPWVFLAPATLLQFFLDLFDIFLPPLLCSPLLFLSVFFSRFPLQAPPDISFFLPAPLFFPCFVSSSASHVRIPSHLPPESSPLQSPFLPQNSSPIMSSGSGKER